MIDRARLVVVALTSLAIAAPGCGGGGDDEGAAPLALHERVVRAGDIEEYAVHDGERLKDAEVAAEQFTPIFTSPNDPAREELVSRLEQAGFVAGYADELRSTRTGGDGGSIVLRLGSADGARALVDWVFRQGIKPCPGVCDVQIEAVEGADIPGARGIHRSRAKTTENGQGFDLELIAFADGPFLYGIAANGPPKTIDESQFVHGAERLYERVKGHPPA